jgi:predicted DNA-binding protein
MANERVHIILSEELKAKAKALAKEQNKTLTDVVRASIVAELEKATSKKK